MRSAGAVFSHNPGEFPGIKQLLLGGAALVPRSCVLKASNLLTLRCAVREQGGLLPAVSIMHGINSGKQQEQEEAVSVMPKADFSILRVTCHLSLGDGMASLLLAPESQGSFAQVD